MIRTALCDDSVKSYKLLKHYLQQYETVCGEHIQLHHYRSSEELIFSYQCQYDVLFLETVINRKSGVDAAKSIRQIDERVSIIFITMYRTFGSESYQIHASDYLLKPLTYSALEKAMNQVCAELLKMRHCLITTSGGRLVKFPIDNILYISYFNHRLIFHLFSGETEEAYSSFKNLFRHPDTECLYQIHKSYVINMLWIERIENKTVYIKNTSQGFLVSKQRWPCFIAAYKDFIL